MVTQKFIPFDHVVIPTQARPGEWFECKPTNAAWHHCWNITRANQLMILRVLPLPADGSPRRIVRCALTPHNKDMILNSGTETDPDYLWSDRCDPRRPILSVVIDGREWIIDGWHRARRAVLMGWEDLPAFILTTVEDHACRVCTCCRGEVRAAAAAVEGTRAAIRRELGE